MTFSQELTATEETSSCAAYASAAGMPCKRVICPNLYDACGNPPPGAAAAAPTTPVVTPVDNTTATNTTTRRRRILQNCTIANCETCSATNSSICTKCNGTNIISSDATSCVATCPAGEEAVSGACVKKSTKKSYYFTTQPDPYVADDTTFADITKAVITNKATFDKLFKLKAGLPASVSWEVAILP